MKLCPFFYDLQDVMEDRASTKPLFSSGCEIEREDEDDVLVEQEGSGEEIADRLFWAIHERISDDVEFFSVPPVRRKRGSSELHLLVLLKFLGSNGNEATASKLGQFFEMSKGSFLNYRD